MFNAIFFSYLAIDAFKKELISEQILRRLLNQDIVHSIKCKGKEKDDPSLFIFQQNKAVDFFVLILEGRVEVTVGKESLLFESGPFTYFGTQALVSNVVVGTLNFMSIYSYIHIILLLFSILICRFSLSNGIIAVVDTRFQSSSDICP